MRVVAVTLVTAMLLACAALAESPTAVIQTTTGPVQGVFNDKSGINVFRGIPYAAPPVGELRFADPKPAPAWTSTLNATTFAPGCMAICPPVGFPKSQLMCAKTVSEDCLYLNVYAPAAPSKPLRTLPEGHKPSPTGGLPVVFFIHGGNFQYGSGGVPLYDGQQLARTQHVVVVTINYRLGVLGALYTGTLQGNFMLKDQIMAMRWVQDNIAAFGGDPARVTISGQSAGAFSVATHITMPASQGLFSGAIIISYPATLLAANPVGAMQLGTKVLEGLNCPQSGGVLELDCLRKAPAEVVANLTQHTDYSPDPSTLLDVMMQWVPVVDGDFVPMQPLDAYERGNVTKVPVFFGTVANESVEFIFELSPKPMSAIATYVLADLIFGSELVPNITQLYGPIPESMAADARPYLDVLATDFIFYCSARGMGGQLSKVVPTFMWFFDYLSYINEWVFGKTMPFCVNNVCHAEDLAFVFFPYQWIPVEEGEPLPPPEKEFLLADIVQGAWGAFAYTGNPNPLGVGLPASAITPGTAFPQFNASENLLVNYSVPTSPLVGYRNDVCDFWDKVGYRKRR